MSTSSSITNLFFITRQINIFAGASILIGGVIGNFLTIIIFLSLQTFRENSCSFYLSVMSIMNIGQLLTGLLSRVTINASGIDWTQLSLVYCKLRSYLLVACTNISMISMCLATIDQYFATCHRPRWQRWSSLKSARYLSIISIIFSLLTSIPCLFYYKHTVSPTTGKIICATMDSFFNQLNIYFYRLIISNILPLFVSLVFGLLTYRNVKQIAYRSIPLVRRELDKQLTVMILVQDLFTFVILLPVMASGFISLNLNFTHTPLTDAQYQLANAIAVVFYYLYFAVPFYIYVCVSERFRRQLKYVFVDIHYDRWRRRKNNIVPVIIYT